MFKLFVYIFFYIENKYVRPLRIYLLLLLFFAVFRMICYFLLALPYLPPYRYLPTSLSIYLYQTDKKTNIQFTIHEFGIWETCRVRVITVSESAPPCQIKQFQFYTYMYLLTVTFEFHTSYLLLINKAHPQAFPALFPQTSGSTT